MHSELSILILPIILIANWTRLVRFGKIESF